MIAFEGYAGLLPGFFSTDDPRHAREQANTAYAFAGGWSPFEGFQLIERRSGKFAIKYPSDPPREELARGHLRDELIVVFQGDWVAIIQPDRRYEIARMD